MRKIININDNWRFIQNDIPEASAKDFSTETWENIAIPHTWNAVDGINGGNNYFKGACWYRKEVHVSKHEEGRRVYIEFGAANSVSDVYLNGTHLGQHKGGYSIFRYDITDVIKFGARNTIAVKVDNTIVDDIYPIWADFTFYGGIYRDVNIITIDPIHFDLMDHGSKGIYVVQEEVNNDLAKLTIKMNVANKSDLEQPVRIWAEVKDQEGNVIKYAAKDVVMATGENGTFKLPINIENPILWNGIENPYLYDVHVTIMRENDVIDEMVIPTGLRYYSFDAKEGFFLNGKAIKLKGVSRHQDKKDKGWALSKEDQEQDMALIKEVGANSIRLAHYQHNQYFYDLCDKEGMVIWAEIPFISIMSKTDLKGENAKSQMVELVRQNFNHSSILVWGVQNEIQIGGITDELRTLVQELHALTKEEDPTRLTTQAQVMMVPDDDEFHMYTDIVAYNKYYGWYMGAAEDFATWLDAFHETNPNIALGISEYGAEGITKYHSDTPEVKDYTEEYHALYHEKVLKIFNERPFVWGTYVWNFFDFGSDFRDEGGVKGRNNKGLITFDRKVKKDAFYWYKAAWSNETFIHITSKRFIDRATDTINVKVYSTCDEVTLKVNGTLFGSVKAEDGIFIFENVSLVDGNNEVYVVGTRGEETVTDFAMFNKVSEPNPVYNCTEESGGLVTNWFEDDTNKFDGVVVEELNITDDVYSTACKISELMDNNDTKAIMEKYLSEMIENPMFSMAQNMSINDLSQMAAEVFTEKFIYVLNKELTQFKK